MKWKRTTVLVLHHPTIDAVIVRRREWVLMLIDAAHPVGHPVASAPTQQMMLDVADIWAESVGVKEPWWQVGYQYLSPCDNYRLQRSGIGWAVTWVPTAGEFHSYPSTADINESTRQRAYQMALKRHAQYN